MKKHFSSCDECNALNVWCVSLDHAYAGSSDVCADCLIKALNLLPIGDTVTSFKGILHELPSTIGVAQIKNHPAAAPWLCPKCNNSGSYAIFDGKLMAIKQCGCKSAHKPKTFGGTATIHG